MIESYPLTYVAAFIIGFGTAAAMGVFWVLRTRHEAHLTFEEMKHDHQEVRDHLIQLEEKARYYDDIQQERNQFLDQLMDMRLRCAELETLLAQERKQFQDKYNTLQEARDELSQGFQALSAQALERNNRTFLELAHATLEKFHEAAKGDLNLKEQAIADLVHPIKQSLSQVDQKIEELERNRQSAYEVLRHQVGDMVEAQKELRSETANLVKALRTPHIRGRWGEMQLRRVVEMSGMSAHCDFMEQVTLGAEEAKLRPDMVVNLPGGKRLVIDAKAPLAAYLDALEAKEDHTRLGFLKDHARHVRTHITDLSKRSYWNQFENNGETPEFVVMFLPGETIFSAALEQDPLLIEMGVEKQVILATPATLIALLHAVAYGWRQERIAENARDISQLGRELYKRISDMGNHMARLGQSLGGSVKAYNSAVATLETRILPSARRFKDLEAGSSQHNIENLPPLDHVPRDLQAPELRLREAIG